jgi:hypothetical protein
LGINVASKTVNTLGGHKDNALSILGIPTLCSLQFYHVSLMPLWSKPIRPEYQCPMPQTLLMNATIRRPHDPDKYLNPTGKKQSATHFPGMSSQRRNPFCTTPAKHQGRQ